MFKIKLNNSKNVENAVKNSIYPDIQILMLGARRVGKTSVLASVINEFNKVSSETNLVLTKTSGAKAIDDALQTMKGYFLEQHQDYETRSLDNSATTGFDKFDLELRIAQKKNSKPRSIRFVDVAGEWINKYMNKEKIGEEVERSDIIIVAVDSVLLMEKNGKYQGQNCANNVTNFITEYMSKEGNINKHKMVLFVPLKCEKYYHQNDDKMSMYYGKRMEELNDRIKDEYSELFAYLTKPANKDYFTVAILPILTLGGIEFFGFSDDFDFSNDIVTSDKLIFRYCEPCKFNPMYCEQPLLYTLMYEYKKISDEYVSKAYKNGVIGQKKTSRVILEWLMDKMSYAKDEDYKSELEKLNKHLKRTGNGFEIIQNPIGL